MALLLRRSLICSFGRKHLPVSTDLLFFSTSSNDGNLETLISAYDFSPEAAFKVSSHIKSSEKLYSLISLLKDTGFSQSQLERTICSSLVLDLKVDTIRRKIKVFRDLGFDPGDIAETVSSDSRILLGRTELLMSAPSVSALTKVLGCFANVSAFKVSSWCLRADLNNTLVPNVEFLKQCGVDSEQITRYGSRFPRFLLHKPEKIQEFVEMVDRMGVPRLSGRYLHAIKTVSSMSSDSWGRKWDIFRSLGFSEDEILDVFRRSPQVLAVSDKKIMDVWNVMTGIENVGLSVLLSRPIIFLLSVEKRLKPRLKVYQILESRNLLKNKIKLTTLCSMSNKQFSEFVSRYADELGDEFAAFKSFKGSKER